jgi:hypothetical protein
MVQETPFMKLKSVCLEDLGIAALFAESKAITLMRYIRKALEDQTFVKA